MSVTIEQALKVYEYVNAGLVSGLGNAVPGQMCIEAAICLAMGEPHGDTPSCVGEQDRALSIPLNDAKWSSDKARADGMRRLAIAQLGSRDLSKAQQTEWLRLVVEGVIRKIVPLALRAAAPLQKEPHKSALAQAAVNCEQSHNRTAADAAAAAAAAAADAAAAAAYAAAAADAYAYAAYAAAYAAAAAAYAYGADAAYAAAYAYAAYAAAAAYGADAAAAARAARAAADAYAAARDEPLRMLADIAVDAYAAVGAPGYQLLLQIEAGFV